MDQVIENVFGPDLTQEIFTTYQTTQDNIKSPSILESVQTCIRKQLSSIDEETSNNDHNKDARPGKLGSKEVRFDVNTHVGLFFISANRLSLNSQSNFSTMKANACFYQGRWQYEVQLGSKGVMQIGWAMSDCKFTQEVGVGDTINSYSYDGHRVRKWNVATYPYGEPWLSGDIIGTTIDLGLGSIVFYRNGHSLGEAFSNLQMGPGFAYFPAVSLALTENLVANFGSTPLKYPVEGFSTPQKEPTAEVAKANLLLTWFDRLTEAAEHKSKKKSTDHTVPSHESMLILLGKTYVSFLGPLLTIPYIIDACFIPFLINLGKKAMTPENISLSPRGHTAIKLNNFLDMFWLLFEDSEHYQILENVGSYLLAQFRRVSADVDYTLQKETLYFLAQMLNHPKTRFYFLQSILFDKNRFANFTHVKPLDDKGLVETIRDPWWEGRTDENSTTDHVKFDKYIQDSEKIKSGLAAVEALQIDFLLSLMDNSDGTLEQPSSRKVFLSKFRIFLHENFLFSRSLPFIQTPLPITLCCFHRLVSCAQYLCKNELNTTFSEIPIKVFLDGSVNYSNIDRFGGLLSHLKKVFHQELVEELGSSHPIFRSGSAGIPQDPFSIPNHAAIVAAATAAATTTGSGTSGTIPNIDGRGTTPSIPEPPVLVGAPSNAIDAVASPGALVLPWIARMLQGQNVGQNIFASMIRGQQVLMQGLSDKLADVGSVDPEASIVEFIDGIILFYHVAAHKQLSKVATIRDNMVEYESALTNYKSRLESGEPKEPVALSMLENSIAVFEQKLQEQSRHMAWVRAAIFTQEKQEQLAWLLRIVISTLQNASAKGKLFSFVPEFYLEALIELSTALRNYFHPTVHLASIEGHEELMMDVGQFLCVHFADPRIVDALSKDTLIQALANFVCNPVTLEYLEHLPAESRTTMVRGLLRPYENRAWAQSNWILVRFWQGNGFAFRYKKSPHLSKKMGPKVNITETALIGQAISDPCPSLVYQSHVRDILLSDEQLATSFVNSVLNQLNWAFSEFIGMLQEIQNLSTRPERIFIESRQLKICATCFDLSLALLRVLEMIANVASPIFCDLSRPNAESLLERICQLLCQILNRICSLTGCFQYVVKLDIPDLEAIDHFPILAAVVGILFGLLNNEMNSVAEESEDESKHPSCSPNLGVVSRALLVEPSFQITSLTFLEDDTRNEIVAEKKSFSFTKYPNDVNEEELKMVKKIINHLTCCQLRLSLGKECDEDALCSICYAYPICTVFHPCSHQSCRSCIVHHLMNNQHCFFCKTPIQKVTMNDGKILYEFSDLTNAAAAPSSTSS